MIGKKMADREYSGKKIRGCKAERLEVKNISISYDRQCILDDIYFSVEENEFVSIIGPSGVGKSTLLKMLASILPLEQGDVLVDGLSIKTETLRSRFAYMPQSDLLFPWLTVYENVSLYDSLHAGGKLHKKEEVLRLIEQFGLGGYEFVLPEKLSGGMRQRVAFLRTVLCPADIFLLDEPFGALDVMSRNKMQDWLLSLQKSLKRTILLVTHDLEEAIYLSDRILVLAGQPASLKQIYSIPQERGKRTREWLFEQSEMKKELFWLLADSSL